MSEDGFGLGCLLTHFRKKSNLIIIICAFALGICLILLSDGKNSADDYDSDSAARGLEERVANLCSEMRGVSNVSVMITLDTVSETKYAQNSQVNKDENNINTRYEYVSGSQGLLPVAEVMPRVRGIAVVCTGGGNPDIQLKLTELLSALFGIPSSAVSIAEGK